MIELLSSAVRFDESIKVKLHGLLPNDSWGVTVVGTYPGQILHATDSGHAEIYMIEYAMPGLPSMLWSPAPWSATLTIDDLKHSKVAIYVNDKMAQIIPVSSSPASFEVYTFVGTDHWGTVILPVGHTMGWLFHRVFGPASHEDCIQWTNEHSKIGFF